MNMEDVRKSKVVAEAETAWGEALARAEAQAERDFEQERVAELRQAADALANEMLPMGFLTQGRAEAARTLMQGHVKYQRKVDEFDASIARLLEEELERGEGADEEKGQALRDAIGRFRR